MKNIDIYIPLRIPKFAWLLFIVAVITALWSDLVMMEYNIGVSYLIFNFMFLAPIILLIKQNMIKNQYSKFLLFVILFLSFDTFYYNNNFVQYFLPLIIFFLMILVYTNSMKKAENFYELFLVDISIFSRILFVIPFLKNLFALDIDKTIYQRVGKGIFITIPIMFTFIILLGASDENFARFLSNIFSFNINIEEFISKTIKVPIFTLLFLALVISSFSAHSKKQSLAKISGLDIVVVGIVSGMVNLLFLTFILFQLPYLFGGEEFIKESSINYAQYARDGFFELSMVMTLSSLIMLYIFKRLYISTSQNIIKVLQIILAIEVVIIGFSSLNKMFVYQNIYGATGLRYYVEWFTYFLIILLIVYITFLIIKKNYKNFLNYTAVISMVALMIISSINIDKMIILNHQQKQQKDKSFKLDYNYLTLLSIDIADSIDYKIFDKSKLLQDYKYRRKNWIDTQKTLRDCSNIFDFHLGYCVKKGYLNK